MCSCNRKSCFFSIILFFSGLLFAVGCGTGKISASGKVSMNGAPVVGGSLTFAPIASDDSKEAGKPASGKVNQDGTFTLGTDSAADGVTPGRYRILYSPPPYEYPEGVVAQPGVPPPASPYDNKVPKVSDVEIVTGSNSIEIELVPR